MGQKSSGESLILHVFFALVYSLLEIGCLLLLLFLLECLPIFLEGFLIRKWLTFLPWKCLQTTLALLLDPYVLLGMLALLPMLEAVDTLIQWAQKRDAFICDFVAALGTCQANLYTFYLNADTTFRRDEFHAYNQVIQCSHEQILLKWEANLNLPCETLMFVVGGEAFYALHDGNTVTREGYAAIIASVQQDCKGKFF